MARTERTRKSADRRQDWATDDAMVRGRFGFKNRRHGKERRAPRDLESPEDYAELDRLLAASKPQAW